MYLPPHFEETDSEAITGLIARFPLAVIVCVHDGDIIANHLPLMLNGKAQLIGHIARSNRLHELIEDGEDMLAIFRAEDAYISPNWYPTKQETHRHVPTWNYQTVHVRGRVTFSHEHKDKLAVVGKLTKSQERQASGDRAWKMSDAPQDFMAHMLDNIVAFRIDIESISAKSKLSQNRDAVDFDSVSDAMRRLGKDSLSAEMDRIADTRKSGGSG
ncbi:MAG: transcriptional regulator [SAR116 cluster bacterium]|nr:transcriptional regulator [SAR116 cluster bacterium]RPG98348.1 MAG: FMN-binding negative transcriptional regulator [Candidatus Puniceispirillum sp. TMED176]